MTPEEWNRVRSVVEDALQLPAKERAAFVHAQTGDDDLAREAMRLLAFDGEASAMFSIDSWRNKADEVAPEQSLKGLLIGPYRTLREVGRGGMGAVYLGERSDGAYEQRVAIKVLQEHIFTPALHRRFTQERQILAHLQHPLIARLLDGGVLPDGRPYLVMEYVDGLPIDVYCETNNLSLKARLRLLLRVAEAVQAAHQQLVLHLDLKPANILVTEAGEPRLLDFGIARMLTDLDGTSVPESTLRLLTPRYASPEQARGAGVGVASDVFSLGTLAYRLLTGRLPYPLETATPLETARIISEETPETPSHAADDVASSAALRGDLDTILLQSLRKEPERRYPTVAAFREDIRRHLASEPVSAHADTFTYRARKFLRRHRGASIASAVAVVVLMVSAAAVVRAGVVARQQRSIAERRLAGMRGLAHSYVFDLDAKLDQIAGTSEVRRFVLDNALQYLESMSREAAGDDGLVRETAQGYSAIGQVYATPNLPSLSDYATGEAAMRKGLALQERLVREHPGNVSDLEQYVRQLRHYAIAVSAEESPAAGERLLLKAWDASAPIYRLGPTSPYFYQLGFITQAIAVTMCAPEGAWDLADPVGAGKWVERTEALIREGEPYTPQRFERAMVHLTESTLMTKACVLGRTGRAAEARVLYPQAISMTVSSDRGVYQEHNRKVFRQLYGAYLVSVHDTHAADAIEANLLHDFDDFGSDRSEHLYHLAGQTLAARLDVQAGRKAAGGERLLKVVDTLEGMVRSDPHDADVSAELAWDSFWTADAKVVSPGRSEQMYARAEGIAAAVVRRAPDVLGAELMMARCELGIADLKRADHRDDDARRHAASAMEMIQVVLHARPGQPEAEALLQRASSFER